MRLPISTAQTRACGSSSLQPSVKELCSTEHGCQVWPCFLLRLASGSRPGYGSNCRPGAQALPTSGNISTEANEAAFRVSRALGRELKIDRSLKMAGNGGEGQAGAGGAPCTLV